MHPLSLPVKLIIDVCAVIIGLNVFILLWLQTFTPTTRVSRLVRLTARQSA